MIARGGLAAVCVVAAVATAPRRGLAQVVTERGFMEGRALLFPQRAPNDPERVVVDFLAREEAFFKPAPWIQFAAGLDLRANTHDQVDGSWRLDIADRGTLRPAMAVRRVGATLTAGPVTIDVGKQFIRWGKTDIVTPTDRFGPRDFLNVIDNEFLPVSGARGVFQFKSDTLDVAWVPFFTPSRTPLLNQRWAVAPAGAPALLLSDAGSSIPNGSQKGVRWGHEGGGYEYSLSFFDGFNHLPNIELVGPPAPSQAAEGRPLRLGVIKRYPALRMYGGDWAMPTRWFTVKGEAAYFTSTTPDTDEYILYVVQLERQTGEWLLVGGWAGEIVTARRAALTFAPDRGMTRSIVARASYTIDSTRSLALEGAVRQNGRGVYGRSEYSQAYGRHWRATLLGILIKGALDDFLGQYRRNSNVVLALRYSF